MSENDSKENRSDQEQAPIRLSGADPEAQASSEKGFEIYKRVLTRALPYWPAFLLGVLGYVIYGITQPLSAKALEMILDSMDEPYGDIHTLLPLGIVAIFAFRGLGTLMGSYGMAYVARHVVHQLRVDMFSKLVHLPLAYFATTSPGHLVSRMTFNVEQVGKATSSAVTVLIRESIVVISLLVYLLIENWQLTLVFLLVLPPVSLIVALVSKRFRRLGTSIQNSMGDVTQVSSEVINAYQEVRIYGTTEYEDRRFFGVSRNNLKQSLKFALTEAINAPVIQLLVAMALSFIVWLVLNPDFMGTMTQGQFMGYMTAAGLLDKPVRQLAKINGTIQVAIAAAQSLFNLLDEERQEDSGDKVMSSCEGNVVFENVSFAYKDDGEDVVKNVSFEAKAGECVALVGRSGGGKSSLVGLIPRFYEINKGKILLDGEDIRDLTLESLREQVALVSQKVTLFNDSIYHNIAYGDLKNATQTSVEAAAKLAFADQFISKLDEAYDTQVGQDGIQLSGGQRQRIAIARALLKDAPVIIMDEATSALDNESEAMIQKALEGVRGKKTMIVIAHRLSTVENADRILVLDNGEIVESGTHKTLIEKQGYYARLHNSQLEFDQV